MRLHFCWILALVACAPRSPAPAPRPPIRIPAGCAADQSGHYVHADNPTFLYHARDDGGTLVLRIERAPRAGTEDGGEPSGPGPAGDVRQQASGAASSAAAPPDVVLERTPQGFVGQAHGPAFLPSGQVCRVAFPTEVVACTDGGLLLRTTATMEVDEGCQPAPRGGSTAMKEHQLWRRQAGPRDGGTPDGGTPDGGAVGGA